MGCGSCSTRGCGGLPKGCKNNGSCGSGGCNKLNVFDWLSGMENPAHAQNNYIEVRFKNSRKEFFKNADNISLVVGDVVVVESTMGYDVGVVSLKGELVRVQMKKKRAEEKDLLKVLRKANQEDVDCWLDAQNLEEETKFKARKVVTELKLEMKISDVEYQGDQTKATFFYTADNRVDFRELIKILAEKFKVKIEMRQIGARQEASLLGGIGTCGRELCCSTWLTDFRSVSTSAARYQQLSLNPQKLAGQCGKLKCCLNYELDTYLDALKDFPKGNASLKTKKGDAKLQKTDIFRQLMWYAYTDDFGTFIEVPLNRVKEIIELNKNGKYPEDLVSFSAVKVEKQPDFENVVGQDSLNRFDNNKKKKKKKRFNKKGREKRN